MSKYKLKRLYLIILFIILLILFELIFVGIPFKISNNTIGISIHRQNYDIVEDSTIIDEGNIKYEGTLYKRLIKDDYFAGSIQLSNFNNIPEYYNKKFYLSFEHKRFRHDIISAVVNDYARIIGQVLFSDKFKNVIIETEYILEDKEIKTTIVSGASSVREANKIISNIYEGIDR